MTQDRYTNEHDAEPARDPELAASLRRAGGEDALHLPDEIRAAARRREIVRAAGPLLARLRHRAARLTTPAASWWEWTASWSRPAIPIGLAAAIAAAMLVAASRERTAEVLRDGAADDRVSLVTAALRSAPAPEAVEAVIGPAWRDWLFAAAVSGDQIDQRSVRGDPPIDSASAWTR